MPTRPRSRSSRRQASIPGPPRPGAPRALARPELDRPPEPELRGRSARPDPRRAQGSQGHGRRPARRPLTPAPAGAAPVLQLSPGHWPRLSLVAMERPRGQRVGRAVSGGRALLREMVPEARTLAPRGGDGDRFWTQPGRGARRPAGLLPPAALACSTAGRLGVLSKAPTVTSSCRWSATATPLPRRACCPSSPAHTLPLAVPSSLARPLPWLPSQRVPRSASHLSLGSGKPQLGAGAS